VTEALTDATAAYERERYGDALRILRPLAEEYPDVSAIRELAGLACYRDRRWADAVRHLTKFVELTASVEQHPVLADAHRALRHHGEVERLWEELAADSPSAELVAEGRIVMAGSLADRGQIAEAIALIMRAPLRTKRPKAHHLRLWYVLADLYERAGDLPRARERFTAVAAADPEFADVAQRLAALGR
jgi:tetratricopeptide (TPR) repeat protein